MKTILLPLLLTPIDLLRSRASLQLEVLALRQQLSLVTNRDGKRLSFSKSERIFWVWLHRLWPECIQTLMNFKPDTLLRWHRKGFQLYWTWKSRPRQGGHPVPSKNIIVPEFACYYGAGFRKQVLRNDGVGHRLWVKQQVFPYRAVQQSLIQVGLCLTTNVFCKYGNS